MICKPDLVNIITYDSMISDFILSNKLCLSSLRNDSTIDTQKRENNSNDDSDIKRNIFMNLFSWHSSAFNRQRSY